MCTMNLLSNGILFAISKSNSTTFSVTMSKAIPKSSPETITERTEAIPESNSEHSHFSTLLLEGRLRQWLCEAVGEHLSSRYVAQVDLSISSHTCRKVVFAHNVCNWSSAVESILDARDQ